MMNIGMILDNEFTGDLRVENEVETLVKAGFNVKVLCFSHGKKPLRELYKGGEIMRIPIKKLYKNKMKGLCNTPFDLYTPYWSKKIKQFVTQENIDVIHVHDLYLVGGALKAKAKIKKPLPIVADLHENYPEALKYYKFSNTFPGNIIISIKRWQKIEVEWLNKVDKIIVVVEEAYERIKKLGIPEDKIFCVSNYVNHLEFLSSFKIENHTVQTEDITLTYVGGFDWHRGINTAIEALPHILKHFTKVKLNLVGDGINIHELKNLCKQLKVENYVNFTGWLNPKQLPEIIHQSSICFIPHIKTNHTDNTMPHKLLQYMLLKKPVLSSNCNSLVRIIEDTKAGEIFESGNANDFAQKVLKMIANPNLLNDYGKNGYEAVMNKYNWDKTAKNLINLYKNLDKI